MMKPDRIERERTVMGRRRLLQLGLGAGTAVALAGRASPAHAAMARTEVVVGSKDFTENLICGEMAAAMLENAGYAVTRKLHLGGTAICHQALASGNIDTYIEYTGTGLTAILKLPVETDPATAYAKVSAAYKARFKLDWLKQWGFNDTYAIVVRKDTADRLRAKTVSDLKGKAESLTLGATQEFIVRPDGLPGLEKAYGIKFKAARGMDFGLMYQAAAKGDVDAISGFSTDGRIITLGLVILQDDKRFFPPYFAAPVVREAKLSQDPKIADVLNRLAGKIDDKVMADLNLLVDQNKMDPGDVAKQFLKQAGLAK